MHFSVCQSAYENSGVDFRVNSRLLLLLCGLNYPERLQTNVPDAYYFVWEDNKFKQILDVVSKMKIVRILIRGRKTLALYRKSPNRQWSY